MGTRTRRAVRGLKLGIQSTDPSMSLASASDTVLRLIGKRGFTDVKSCKVGVPVASAIPSPEKPNSSSSATSSNTKSKDKGKGRAVEEMSLADMMKSTSPSSDEGITKMVAKVGRWWYSRCYETLPSGKKGEKTGSIFNDESLLRECEQWNSSFKLVVAYAQKPIVGRRRTVSV